MSDPLAIAALLVIVLEVMADVIDCIQDFAFSVEEVANEEDREDTKQNKLEIQFYVLQQLLSFSRRLNAVLDEADCNESQHSH